LRIAASGVLQRTGLTVAAATTGARKPRELNDPHLLFFRPSYQDEIAMIVRHAATLGLRRFAFFHEDSDFGADGVQAMRTALPAHGAQQVASHAYKPGQADFTEAARAFMQSDAQAVVLFAVQNVAARFLKSLRRAGLRKPVFSISVINADALAAELGADDARGIGVVQVVPAPDNPKIAVARQFQAALAASGRAGHSGSQSALEGYIVGQMIAAGMKRARGPLTREGFGAAMRAVGTVELGGMRAALSSGMAQVPHYMELGVIDGGGKLRN
jgi:ABC-type branched-subunit amino acid transport system substrate-binding protein